MMKIDKLDRKILAVLDWHGRMPVNRIAKLVQSNKDVVAYRTRKLEEKGIIARYFPVIDMHKLGYHTVRLYFDLDELSPEEERAFVDFIDKEIRVGVIFRMDYPYRYGFLIWKESIYDVEDAVVRIKARFGGKIVRYNFTIFPHFKIYPKDYLFGNERHEAHRELKRQERVDYDKEDFSILNELAENARATTTAIAKRLSIPQTTVSSKIRRMERIGIILGYRAEIDYVRLEHMNYFLEIYLATNEELAGIEAWADMNPNVVWLQKIIGTCDIEIEVEVKDRVALESLLNDLRTTFPSIRRIVFWSQEYKKITFLPAL